jgi:uncharacterized membrane protein YfcA
VRCGYCGDGAVVGIAVAAAACLIGVSIGIVGIGGIFLIPLLLAAGIPQEDAIGTSLVTFTVTGAIATVIFARRGAIDWRSAAFTSAGSVAGGPLGAKLSVLMPPSAVGACFAAFLVGTGTLALLRKKDERERSPAPGVRWPGLVLCGLAVGIGSGITGVGGPAILVPLLLLLKFPTSVAVGISQPNAVAASASAALGHLAFGRVDGRLAALLSVVAGGGTLVGANMHAKFSAEMLRKLVGAACIVLGLWLGGALLHRLGT